MRSTDVEAKGRFATLAVACIRLWLLTQAWAPARSTAGGQRREVAAQSQRGLCTEERVYSGTPRRLEI